MNYEDLSPDEMSLVVQALEEHFPTVEKFVEHLVTESQDKDRRNKHLRSLFDSGHEPALLEEQREHTVIPVYDEIGRLIAVDYDHNRIQF